jgi:hypothetical protein
MGPNKNPLSVALGQRHPIQTPKSRTANENMSVGWSGQDQCWRSSMCCCLNPWTFLMELQICIDEICIICWLSFFSWPHVIFLGEISFSLDTSHLCCFSPHFFAIFQSRTAFPALRTASFDVYQRQVMMFSATMSAETRQLCKKFMQAPGHGVTITRDIFANQFYVNDTG